VPPPVALQTAGGVHCAFEVHCAWHWWLAVLQTRPPAQSVVERQATQIFVVVSHCGVVPLQSAFARQPTHWLVAVSQTGAPPRQSLLDWHPGTQACVARSQRRFV
jgi:hypothetical protein